VSISAKQNVGLDLLEKAIEKILWTQGPPSKEEIVISELRHYTALQEAMAHCKTAWEGLAKGKSPELITSDLRACLTSLGTIIGMNVTEDLLSAIFSKFCLGK
jgi:tRNA modification GTPase